jgi:chromosome partitioning protein
MKTIVIGNQKGGTGKSTFACHLAFFYAEKGKRVAFINCETQGNSSTTLAKNHPVAPVNATAFFGKDTFPIESLGPITVYAGGGFLADVERTQGNVFKPQVQRLAEHFDVCIIDTPPTASVLQIAPLTAADFVISPIEMEDYSMQGVTDMLRTIMGVRQRFNPTMAFLGMLPNRLKGTSPRQKTALADLLNKYPQFVFAPESGAKIGERQAIPEALAEGIPVWKLKKTSAREAADEILKILNLVAEKVDLDNVKVEA